MNRVLCSSSDFNRRIHSPQEFFSNFSNFGIPSSKRLENFVKALQPEVSRGCVSASRSPLSLFPQSDARVSTTRKQLIAYPMHSNLSQALDFVLFSQTSEEWKGPLCRSRSFISASPEKAAHKTNQKSSINDLRNEKWSLKRRDKIVTIFILKIYTLTSLVELNSSSSEPLEPPH